MSASCFTASCRVAGRAFPFSRMYQYMLCVFEDGCLG
jgi:hypothetical protein